MILVLAVLAAPLTAGQSDAATTQPEIASRPEPELSPEAIHAAIPRARQLLEDHLPDYRSSKFRGVKVEPKATVLDGKAVSFYVGFCGEINPKNVYGGYSGWYPFIIDGKALTDTSANEVIVGPDAAIFCRIRPYAPGDYTDALSPAPSEGKPTP